MRTYAIAISVTPGTGDYGSNYKTIFDGKAKKSDVEIACKRLEEENIHYKVFCGRDKGRMIICIM